MRLGNNIYVRKLHGEIMISIVTLISEYVNGWAQAVILDAGKTRVLVKLSSITVLIIVFACIRSTASPYEQLNILLERARETNSLWLPQAEIADKWDVSYLVNASGQFPSDPSYQIAVSGPYNLGILFRTPAYDIVYNSDSMLDKLSQSTQSQELRGRQTTVISLKDQEFIAEFNEPIALIGNWTSTHANNAIHPARAWDYSLYIDNDTGRIEHETFIGVAGYKSSYSAKYDLWYDYSVEDKETKLESIIVLVEVDTGTRIMRWANVVEMDVELPVCFPKAIYASVPIPQDSLINSKDSLVTQGAATRLIFSNARFTQVSNRNLGPRYPSVQ